MHIEFDVKMTTGKLYDYMLQHTFTSFQGLLGETIGMLLIVLYFMSGKFLYLALGIVVVLYLPITLYMNAKKQMLTTPVFKEPMHYSLTEEGIEIKVGEIKEFQEWKQMHKAVSTSKSIIVYTSKINASIFPREDMGDQCITVIQMISTHMPPGKVKIRS